MYLSIRMASIAILWGAASVSSFRVQLPMKTVRVRPSITSSVPSPSTVYTSTTTYLKSSTSNEDIVSPSQLLYKEQEKLLVRRGQLEAVLMSEAPCSELPTIVVKGAGSSGGFGGNSKGGGVNSSSKKKNKGGTAVKSSSTSSNKLQAQLYASTLESQGVVRIDNVLSPKTADQLRDHVFRLRKEADQRVKEGSMQSSDCFADVLLQNHRCDLKLPLVDLFGDEESGPSNTLVAQALLQILVTSPVGSTLRQLLGDDAMLHELSCLISDPGSDRQVMHPDTPMADQAVLYTCFVALQDVHHDMGPTVWLPNTHTHEKHDVFSQSKPIAKDDPDSPKDNLLRTQPILLGVLPKGSCGIFDSRLLHCGDANSSTTSRAIFYFSFKNPSIGYSGNPPSIRQELSNRLTLSNLQYELTQFSQGKPTDQVKAIYGKGWSTKR